MLSKSIGSVLDRFGLHQFNCKSFDFCVYIVLFHFLICFADVCSASAGVGRTEHQLGRARADGQLFVGWPGLGAWVCVALGPGLAEWPRGVALPWGRPRAGVLPCGEELARVPPSKEAASWGASVTQARPVNIVTLKPVVLKPV